MGRKGYIALLVIVLLCLLTYWSMHSEEQRYHGTALQLWLDPEQKYMSSLNAMVIDQPDQEPIRLEKIDGLWVVPEKNNYPASVQRVSELLRLLRDGRRLEVETDQTRQHGPLWLAEDGEPGVRAVKLALEFTHRAPVQLRIGRQSRQTMGQFVRRAGDDQVWLIDQRIDLPLRRDDWLERRITDIPPEAIAKLDVRYRDGGQLSFVRSAEQPDRFTLSQETDGELAQELVTTVPQVFTALYFDDVGLFGQLNDPVLQLSFDLLTRSDGRLSGELYQAGGADWIVLGKRHGIPAAQLPARGEPVWAFRISETRLQQFAQKFADLQHEIVE